MDVFDKSYLIIPTMRNAAHLTNDHVKLQIK